MKLYCLVICLVLYNCASGQIFLLCEGDFHIAADLRGAFNERKAWPRLFAEGYRPTDEEFQSMCTQYEQYFPEERLRKSLMLVQNPNEKDFVRWTLGTINPDKTITIHGQLFAISSGTGKSLQYPMISGIKLIPPAEVQPLDAQLIQKMYTEESRKREKLPKVPQLPARY